MTIRLPRVAAAMLTIALSGALFDCATAPLQAADCLTGPKGVAPQGSHWYYRVDRTTKKNCWYVRAQDSQPRSANSVVAAASPRSQTPLQRSIANARAEASPADIEQTNEVAEATPRFPAPTTAPNADTQAADNVPAPGALRPPDQTPINGVPATAPAEQSGTTAPAIPAPSITAMQRVAADMRPSSFLGGIPNLVLVIVGALVAAAIVGGILIRFSARRTQHQDFRSDEPAPWDFANVGAAVRSPPLAARNATSDYRFAREQEPPIPDEVMQLLSKLTKEAAT